MEIYWPQADLAWKTKDFQPSEAWGCVVAFQEEQVPTKGDQVLKDFMRRD